MLDIIKEKCTGCEVCAAVCPKKCITMISDEEGFLYPSINETVCIGCGLCENSCHILRKEKTAFDTPKSFVAYNSDEEERKNSSSGGIFALLAKEVLLNSGVVYGVALNDCLVAEHIRIDAKEDLYKLQTSKYVQSRTSIEIYNSVASDLKAGITVLYSGTPCQIGALKTFLKKDYANLLTISFICHGVPSPKVWEQYIKWQENKNGSKICGANFRDKSYGWTEFSMRLEFENKKVYKKRLTQDYFLRSFLNNLCLRPSCHACSYKGKENVTCIDIMLADWWGSEQGILPNDDDNKGISSITVFTDKGEKAFNSIKSQLIVAGYDFEKIIKVNRAFCESVAPSKYRGQFMGEIFTNSFDATVKRYAKISVFKVARNNIYRLLYLFLKKIGIVALKKKLFK